MSYKDKDKDKDKHHIPPELIYKISGTSLTISIIIGLIVSHFAPKKEKQSSFMIIFGLGLLIGAVSPPLYQNYILKSQATDPIVAIFLIFSTIGVFLRFPALRKQLKQSRLDGQNKYITVLLCIATSLPLIVHLIWIWQCVEYDSKNAGQNKEMLKVAAPILTFMVISGIFWMFFI